MEDNLISESAARVIDILEQLERLNQMIELHANGSGDSFMVNQYSDLKNRFLEELKELLSEYDVEVLLKEPPSRAA
ncbi:MAG: hypothetical protein AAF798_04380 [Bacteroidota bacterium]